jgi:type VI secretion system protein VasJ
VTLLEKDYDNFHPVRERAKQMAFKWLSEDKYTYSIAEMEPGEAEYEHIVRLIDALGKLKPILEEKFPNGAPFPLSLLREAQKWERSCKPKVQEEKPAPEEKSASQPQPQNPGTSPQQSSSTTSNPASSSDSISEPMETPKQIQGIARRIALGLIEKDPTLAMGYRLLRTSRWDIIEAEPPSNGGQTQLPAPASQQRTYFQHLLSQKEWKTALEKSEAAFASRANHFWIDLQRIAATASKELGEAYAAVHNAILFETAYFIKRVPDVAGLTFADGTAFCDDATKDWITDEVLGVVKSDGENTGGIQDKVDEEQRQVNALVSAGQMEDALDFAQRNIRNSSVERDNFRRMIMVGTILLKAKQPDLAIALLESLDEMIEKYKVDKWEPTLAVEAWSVLAHAYSSGKAQKPQNIQVALAEKQKSIISKISHLDPKQAYLLTK